MKEHPALFKGPMVLAALNGTKTQTRRPLYVLTKHDRARFDRRYPPSYGNGEWPNVPVGHAWTLSRWYDVKVGDRLWGRESLGYDAEYGHFYAATTPGSLGNASGKTYLCSLFDGDEDGYSFDDKMPERGVPSIHMPRRYCRLLLEVTAARIERLQAISREDALAEGIVATHGGYGLPDGSHFHASDPRVSYWSLWEAINGPGSVEQNPWVWAGSFRRLP